MGLKERMAAPVTPQCLCLAVLLTAHLFTSFPGAPLAQICAPVAHSSLLPSSATSCAASRLRNTMWIPTQHPVYWDSTVPLMIGLAPSFHSLIWHSNGSIALGSGPHRGMLSLKAPH